MSSSRDNVGVNIILTIVTCGIYGWIWKARQMSIVNGLLGRQEFSFLTWFLLSIVTCGIWAIYHEYKMAEAIVEAQTQHQMYPNSNLGLISVLLAICGLTIVSMAIQSSELNKFYA